MSGLTFDSEVFAKLFEQRIRSLSPVGDAGVREVVGFINSSTNLTDIRQVAYILATIAHETAYTFKPIAEYGRGRGRKYGIKDKVTGQTYYGRGYVQLTWKYNYSNFSKLLDKDLVSSPDIVLDPKVSWFVAEYGMLNGTFTGKKLGDYINAGKKDYVGARRIINGQDRARDVGRLAEEIEKILKLSLIPTLEVVSPEFELGEKKPEPQDILPIPPPPQSPDIPITEQIGKDLNGIQGVSAQLTGIGSTIMAFLAGFPWYAILGILAFILISYLIFFHLRKRQMAVRESYNKAVLQIATQDARVEKEYHEQVKSSTE